MEEYYRRCLSIPFLDHITTDLLMVNSIYQVLAEVGPSTLQMLPPSAYSVWILDPYLYCLDLTYKNLDFYIILE